MYLIVMLTQKSEPEMEHTSNEFKLLIHLTIQNVFTKTFMCVCMYVCVVYNFTKFGKMTVPSLHYCLCG